MTAVVRESETKPSSEPEAAAVDDQPVAMLVERARPEARPALVSQGAWRDAGIGARCW